MSVDRTRQELSRDECLRLLRRSRLGRVAVSAGALPHVEPVHFRVIDDEVVIRVGRRTRLEVAATDNVVAFEVDAFDEVSRTGWSIVVTGVARRVDEPGSLAALDALLVPSWRTDAGECVLAISTDVVNGARIQPDDGARRRTDRLGTAEVLGTDECWALLVAEVVGRLAVIHGDEPVILPINYVVDRRTLIFRTDPGTKYDHGRRSKVSFEVDGIDHAARTGWSVVASGFLDEITELDSTAFEHAGSLPIDPWAGGRKEHVMRLVPMSVTGRRVGRIGTPPPLVRPV